MKMLSSEDGWNRHWTTVLHECCVSLQAKVSVSLKVTAGT